jgi:pyroglutamyl-peptidase
VTGFEPFGEYKVNPSDLLAKTLEGRMIADRSIAVRVLPVETRSLRDRLERAIVEESPSFIVGIGHAPGRMGIALERVALNVLDFSHADNVGVSRKNDAIERGGPDARIATLPLAEIVAAWSGAGIPGYVSNSAGTFLCNQWLYETLAITASHAPPIPVGFVHVPSLPMQAVEAGAERTPSMTLELMKKALEMLLETVAPWMESRPAPIKGGPADKIWFPRGIREVER